MSDNDRLPIKRRTLLRTIGTGAAVGVVGAGTAGAKPTGRLIVGTKNGIGAQRAKGAATSVHRELDFGRIGRAVAGQFSEQARKALEKNPNVRYIEEDGRMEAIGQALPWGIDRTDSELTQDDGYTGAGAHIAVIDSGIDSDHPDLQANLGAGKAFTSCSGCAEPWDDDNNHGTHCAGTVGAVDNTRDVVGVAPGATLHAVKVLASDGWGTYSDIAAGIKYTADQGWDVASLSIGGSTSSYAMDDAIQYATDNGVLCVAAAGNNGPCTDCVMYPARHPDVIAVSATDANDDLAYFSCTGPEIDIAAPGYSVLSTVRGGTAYYSGTSMACPHVSGAAGLLMANGYSNTEARARLEETAEDIGLGSNEQGNGLLDVEAAMGGDGGDSSPSVSVVSPSEGAIVDGTVTVQVDASDAEDAAGSLSVEVAIDGGSWQTASYSSSSDVYEYEWDTSSVSDGNHIVEAQTTDSGGNTVVSNELNVTTDNNTDPAFVEKNGQVTMEAEAFTGSVSGSGDASSSTWRTFSDSGASGGTAMEAVPNDGVNVGDSTDGPRLDYDVEFNTTGTYYVYVRMNGSTKYDDSVHVGLNGTPTTYGEYGIADTSGDWSWIGEVGGDRVSVDVMSTGAHTVNLWMREDGTQIDQILLSTDKQFDPSDCFDENDGKVIIEAEQYHFQAAGSGSASGAEWSLFSDSSSSAGTALEAVPNEGLNVGDSTDGPQLIYKVDFHTTGTYYVWIRMNGSTKYDDSVHAGLDGTPATYGEYGMADTSGDWSWVSEVGGNRVTVDVTSGGIHEVNVWMREDGTQIDQILLTTDENFAPSGTL